MKKIFLGIVIAVAAMLAALGGLLISGVVDVGADVPHAQPVYELIEFARERSIARRAPAIKVPADIGSAERTRLAAGNYEAMCASCHLRPGENDSEIRAGLYPQPPNLARNAGAAARENPAARRFWVIKHGIKASGMPAWRKGGMSDADIWNLVGFLERLPALSPEQYRSLLASSTGHTHAGRAMPSEAGKAFHPDHAPAAGHHHDGNHRH